LIDGSFDIWQQDADFNGTDNGDNILLWYFY
jgi:hypothetical protein